MVDALSFSVALSFNGQKMKCNIEKGFIALHGLSVRSHFNLLCVTCNNAVYTSYCQDGLPIHHLLSLVNKDRFMSIETIRDG